MKRRNIIATLTSLPSLLWAKVTPKSKTYRFRRAISNYTMTSAGIGLEVQGETGEWLRQAAVIPYPATNQDIAKALRALADAVEADKWVSGDKMLTGNECYGSELNGEKPYSFMPEADPGYARNEEIRQEFKARGWHWY